MGSFQLVDSEDLKDNGLMGRRTLVSALVLSPLILTIVFSKISLPYFSNLGLSIALPLIFCVTTAGFATRSFQLHIGRLIVYLLMAAWICILQAFGKPFSSSSLFFLVVLFFPYTLQISETKRSHSVIAEDSQTAVTNLGFVLSIFGAIQYFAQYLWGPVISFPIEHLLPSEYIIQHYNYLNPLYYGSSIYKSNGIFFLEPSFYSQFIAISLLIELTHRNRLRRVFFHLAALACTFSGTGIIVLGLGVLTLVFVKRRFDILVGSISLCMLVWVIGETLNLDITLSRAGEFSSVGSSGFGRFVSWIYLLEDFFWLIPEKVWTGYGAGTFDAQQAVARYGVFESSFAKMILEFGLPGALLFFGFLFYCVISSHLKTPVKTALLTCVFMNGAYSESIAGIYMTLVLWPMGVPGKKVVGASSSNQVEPMLDHVVAYRQR